MKKLSIVISFIVLGLFAVSCGSGSTKTQGHYEVQKSNAEVYYTCTMHPEVHSDKPGNCPKCGMELVKKEVSKPDTTQIHQPADTMKMN